MQKTNQGEFRIEKVIKKKEMLNEKDMTIHLIVGLIKKNCKMNIWKMSQYFPKEYEPFEGDINVKFGLSSYATKVDLKKCNRNWWF